MNPLLGSLISLLPLMIQSSPTAFILWSLDLPIVCYPTCLLIPRYMARLQMDAPGLCPCSSSDKGPPDSLLPFGAWVSSSSHGHLKWQLYFTGWAGLRLPCPPQAVSHFPTTRSYKRDRLPDCCGNENTSPEESGLEAAHAHQAGARLCQGWGCGGLTEPPVSITHERGFQGQMRKWAPCDILPSLKVLGRGRLPSPVEQVPSHGGRRGVSWRPNRFLAIQLGKIHLILAVA